MNLEKLTRGKKFPEEFNVVVEIPQGSQVKYEVDEDSGEMFVDRFVYTAMGYPFNYGFIPHTKMGDGDPVDVLVISSLAVAAGTVIPARAIGLLDTEDESGTDTKILACPTVKIDPVYAAVGDLVDLPDALKNKIKHFFEHYKELEPGKWVKVKGFAGKDRALEEIQKSV